MPAQTFVQSGQAGMRQNWKPAHAGAVTESKHSNHNLDLKINSRRGRQDSFPHISICLETDKLGAQPEKQTSRSWDQRARRREQSCASIHYVERTQPCNHSQCGGASNQQLVPAGRGEALWDQHTAFLHRQMHGKVQTACQVLLTTEARQPLQQ